MTDRHTDKISTLHTRKGLASLAPKYVHSISPHALTSPTGVANVTRGTATGPCSLVTVGATVTPATSLTTRTKPVIRATYTHTQQQEAHKLSKALAHAVVPYSGTFLLSLYFYYGEPQKQKLTHENLDTKIRLGLITKIEDFYSSFKHS